MHPERGSTAQRGAVGAGDTVSRLCTGVAALAQHCGAAREEAVSSLEVKVERVATKVDSNRYILEEVKDDLRDMRAEQNTYTEAVLEAIERNGH